jgi:hypothetical protein
MTGNRSCPTAPSEIKVWAGNSHTRRAQEVVNLQSWISRHPGRINKQYFGLGDQSKIDARIEVARLLIGAGADVNARQSGSGFTPLRYARSYESRNSAMAALLLTHGADPRGGEETR